MTQDELQAHLQSIILPLQRPQGVLIMKARQIVAQEMRVLIANNTINANQYLAGVDGTPGNLIVTIVAL